MSFRQRNLVADIANSARFTDPNLTNPWGIVVDEDYADDGALWVTVTETSLLNVYSKTGELLNSISLAGTPAPTGLAKIPNPNVGGPRLIFVTENGVIGTYNPALQIPITAVYTNAAAVYKGVAIHGNRIYAADFAGLKVDVFNLNTFALVDSTNLQDPALQAAGYGPFNVYSDGETLYIAYALRGDDNDDVAGAGNGYINAWFRGNLIRLANRGVLNAPWGMLRWENSLLVGNFGNGIIHAFTLRECRTDPCDPCSVRILTAEYCEPLRTACGGTIVIDGLWGLAVGEDNRGLVIYFAAGVQDEEHGLVGSLVPVRAR